MKNKSSLLIAILGVALATTSCKKVYYEKDQPTISAPFSKAYIEARSWQIIDTERGTDAFPRVWKLRAVDTKVIITIQPVDVKLFDQPEFQRYGIVTGILVATLNIKY